MAVSVSYSIQEVGTGLVFPSSVAGSPLNQLDLITRHDGGIAVAGNHAGATQLDIYDGALDTPAQGDQSYTGTAPHLAEADNGVLYLASVTPTLVNYSIVGADGTTLATNFGMGAAAGNTLVAADITAKADGFVVAVQIDRSGDDSFIALDFRGTTQPVLAIDTGGNDNAPSLCTLNDGGIAVAWTQDDGAGNTAIWTAVFEANGDTRVAPQLLDDLNSINRGVSAVALADGGFGVVYQDTDFRAGGDIAFAHLDANGNLTGGGDVFPGFVDVTAGDGDGLPPSQASATLLSNGMVAISYSLDFDSGGSPDNDVRIRVVDPSTNTALDTYYAADSDFNNSHSSSIAALGQGGMVTGWTDDNQGGQGVETELVRTTTGLLHQANVLTGDNLIDNMTGGTRADTIDGGDNNDVLSGGRGRDTLIGGATMDHPAANAGAAHVEALGVGNFTSSGPIAPPFEAASPLTHPDVIHALAHLGAQAMGFSGFHDVLF